MVYVSYSHRIIVDYEFVKWLSLCEQKSMIISKMLRININSREHKKQNILILEEDFQKLCDEGIIKDKDTIRGGISPFNIEEELGDLTNKSFPIETLRLITGIVLTRKKPFQVVLLTTKETKTNYSSKYKEFLEKVKTFNIKGEDEALIILNDLYRSYCSERDMQR